MNLPDVTQPSRDIARGLQQAIEAVLDTPADATSLSAARDVAQLLSLHGLDRLLAVLEMHAGRSWPHELSPMLDRVRRIAERCAIDSDIAPFRESEADLSRLADHIGSFEWAEGPLPGGAERAVFRAVQLADALAELPLEIRSGNDSFERARLNAPTAAALRAAIEWVCGPSGPRRPLEVAVAEGVLELVFTVQDPAGLAAAHAVLAPVGGQLGPWLIELPASGRWLMRVPLVTPRALHLMIVQGDLPLALPWAAVLRVLMLPAGDLEARAAQLAPDVPLLPPLAPLSSVDGERPVVMIASGMLRGLVVADRLVWRLGAEPCESLGLAPSPLQNAVRGDDGNLYWVADPGVLLAPLPPPSYGAMAGFEFAAHNWASAPALVEAVEADAGGDEPETQEAPEERDETPLPEIDLSEWLVAADVAPLPLAADEVVDAAPLPLAADEVVDAAPLPLEADESERVAVPTAGDEPVAPAATRRVLVIEDSITARIFLTRMLESRGFTVCTAGSGADALREAVRGPWWLVCADVELGDVRGAGWLRMLREIVGAASPMAALVRDREDREIAMAGGVSRVLRKPFDEAELTDLIQRVAETREPS